MSPGPKRSERGAAGEVLQRHPVGALSGEGLEAGGRIVRHLAEGEQAGARDAEDVGEQQLGVHPWRLDPGVGEPPRGVGEQRPGVQEPAASSSAVCARVSASMTGSSSPSSTWSRLCALKPTRWSEIRLSGKL